MNSNLTPDTNLALLNATQGSATRIAQDLKTAQNEGDLKRFDEAAQQFEAVFISEMLKPMFDGLETDSMFGGGKGEDMFRGVMLQEYGKLLSQTGQVGISAGVRDELIRMQAQADRTLQQDGIENEQPDTIK